MRLLEDDISDSCHARLKGGKKVSDGGKFSISSAEGGEHLLTIKDAQESDGGEYTVQVANDRAKLSCTASLLVTGTWPWISIYDHL